MPSGSAAYAICLSARRRAGLSQRALAAATGVSPSTIAHIEKGRMEPTLALLTRLVDACGLELRLSLAAGRSDDREVVAKDTTSVTLDAAKVRRARELVAARSVSELLDLALTRLIEVELERRHLAGYLRRPPGAEEQAWAELPRDAAGVEDGTDWASLYGVER